MGNEVVSNEVQSGDIENRRNSAEHSVEPTSSGRDVKATVGERIIVLDGKSLGPGRSEKLMLDKLDLLKSINMIEAPASVPSYQIVRLRFKRLRCFFNGLSVHP